MMTWAPSIGPARPAPVPSAPPHKPYTPPVDLRKRIQGDLVYSDHCQRNIPVPQFRVTQPKQENK